MNVSDESYVQGGIRWVGSGGTGPEPINLIAHTLFSTARSQ